VEVLYAALEQGTSLDEAPVTSGRKPRLFRLAAIAALLGLTGWVLVETGVLDAELGVRGIPSGVSIFISPLRPGADESGTAVPLLQYVGFGGALCAGALMCRRRLARNGGLRTAALLAGLLLALLLPLRFASEFLPGVCAANGTIYQCQTVGGHRMARASDAPPDGARCLGARAPRGSSSAARGSRSSCPGRAGSSRAARREGKDRTDWRHAKTSFARARQAPQTRERGSSSSVSAYLGSSLYTQRCSLYCSFCA